MPCWPSRSSTRSGSACFMDHRRCCSSTCQRRRWPTQRGEIVPIELSVKDIRAQLEQAAGAGAVGVGEPATLLLGRLFHEVFADLTGPSGERNGLRVLLEL